MSENLKELKRTCLITYSGVKMDLLIMQDQ